MATVRKESENRTENKTERRAKASREKREKREKREEKEIWTVNRLTRHYFRCRYFGSNFSSISVSL